MRLPGRPRRHVAPKVRFLPPSTLRDRSLFGSARAARAFRRTARLPARVMGGVVAAALRGRPPVLPRSRCSLGASFCPPPRRGLSPGSYTSPCTHDDKGTPTGNHECLLRSCPAGTWMSEEAGGRCLDNTKQESCNSDEYVVARSLFRCPCALASLCAACSWRCPAHVGRHCVARRTAAHRIPALKPAASRRRYLDPDTVTRDEPGTCKRHAKCERTEDTEDFSVASRRQCGQALP